MSDLFIPEIDMYVSLVKNHLLPAVEKSFEEVNDFERQRYDDVLAGLRGGERLDNYYDYMEGSYEAYEQARDDAANFGMNLAQLSFAFENLTTAGLFHVFEQQARRYLKYYFDVECDGPFPHLQQELKDLDFSRLDELRLVANVVKHGSGPSAEELHGRRPDLLPNPEYVSPLSNQLGFHVDPREFESCAQAVIDFWTEVERVHTSP